MTDTLQAMETLYEIEKQHGNHHHAAILRDLIIEKDYSNLEYLSQVAQAINYDLNQIAREAAAERGYKRFNTERRTYYEDGYRDEDMR